MLGSRRRTQVICQLWTTFLGFVHGCSLGAVEKLLGGGGYLVA
jgi:hypothetical protein